jgi:polyisoprenyl-teichoic acid--peptidoglycan teichoic acid transferase
MDNHPARRRPVDALKSSPRQPAHRPLDAKLVHPEIIETVETHEALPTNPLESEPLPDQLPGKAPVFQYKKKKIKQPGSLKKRILLIGGLLMLGLILYFAAKLFLATSRIITRNNSGGAPALAGSLDPSKLKGEGDGRVNILILGIGGAGHAGGTLSDTILVASIDPRTKDVAMLSIPRDLYVPIPGYGSTKINAAHAYGENNKKGGGPELAKEVVQKVLDIPIHYYIRVDFTGFKQAMDAVGGVDVNVEKALYDPEYPCDNNRGYCPFSLGAGPRHLDGATALKYVRCRHGVCGSDFGRAARQQEVLVALRNKIISAPTLLNPAKISSLIDAIGDHAKTDLSLSDIRKLADIAKEVDTTKIVQKVLDTTPEGLLNSANIGGAYVEIPRAGIGNFSEIQELVHSIFVDNFIKDENARLEIQNGTTRNGLATTVGNMLKSYQYNVVKMVTAENQNYVTTMLYDYSGGKKPYTIRYLENRFGVKAQRASAPAENPDSLDIRVIVGADYKGVK